VRFEGFWVVETPTPTLLKARAARWVVRRRTAVGSPPPADQAVPTQLTGSRPRLAGASAGRRSVRFDLPTTELRSPGTVELLVLTGATVEVTATRSG